MKVIILLVLIGIAASLAMVALRRARLLWHSGRLLELIPPEETSLAQGAWVVFFQNLYGITPPGYKRALFGVPRISFEFWATAGEVSIRCWCPDRLEPMLRVHLSTACPGIEITNAPGSDETLGNRTARAQLMLWRDPIHQTAEKNGDALRGVLLALAAAPFAVLQVVVSPDPGWQRRALRDYDRLASPDSTEGFLRKLLAELVSIILPATQHAAPSSPAHVKPSIKLQLPAPDKALRAGFRVAIRLAVSAPRTADAKHQMHALSSAFRACDGANGLRPTHVWLRRNFDRSLIERRSDG